MWWPACDQPMYTIAGRLPEWDERQGGYVDPATAEPLPTWDEALEAIGDDDPPSHVVRFGPQLRADGVTANSAQVGRMIGYLTKYLTKALDVCHEVTTDAQRRHVDRLAEALRFEACAPTCANWLRYGIQPRNPRPRLTPGYCKGKAHRQATLGFGGRRVLVSRRWSGKSLSDHRVDRREWIAAQLAVLGRTMPDPSRLIWLPAHPGDPGVPRREYLIMRGIADRIRWRAELQTAANAPPDVGPSSPAIVPAA
ncbi:replication initiator [Frankia sp. Cj3]|uniref:replication initiator n=1 Tax=unclassified Frankia TaxID=2632575 RepID=UPI00351CE46A